jgi:A/G-specific adenine glycosylase
MPVETQQALLDWYAAHHRKLPWRESSSPYAVLVSELMLQQTRVDTVLDYFVRWMARWPTLADLAAADVQDVLEQWTGLGYYNRARNLHKAAQLVVLRHGGEMPVTEAELRELPGLGPYTVGAVRSIAFGQPAPLVDGNVARVLARWHALAGDPSEGAAKKAVWQHASDWLQHGPARENPGAWNQALMELGATVCVPRTPRCQDCVVNPWCDARRLGLEGQIPPVRLRKAPALVQASYALVLRDLAEPGQGVSDVSEPAVLLGRRPEGVRWAGLWEPPGCEGPMAAGELRGWLHRQGLRETGVLAPVVHVLTHRRYEAVPVRAEALAGTPDLVPLGYPEARWMSLRQAQSRTSGLSRLAARLLEALLVDAGMA